MYMRERKEGESLMYMGDSIQPQVALRLSFSINLKASRCFTGSLPSHILNPRRTGGLASRGRPLLCCSTIHWNYSPPAAHQWMGDLRMGSLPWQRIKTVKGRAKSCFSFNLFILVPIYLSSTEIYEGYFYLSLSSLSEGYMVSIHRANPTLPNSLGASQTSNIGKGLRIKGERPEHQGSDPKLGDTGSFIPTSIILKGQEVSSLQV